MDTAIFQWIFSEKQWIRPIHLEKPEDSDDAVDHPSYKDHLHDSVPMILGILV